MTAKRTRLAAIATIASLAIATTVEADSPYELDAKLDVPVLAISAGLTLMALVEVPPPSCFPRCDGSMINAIDRVALGNYSETAHTVADVAVAALLTLPLALDAVDSGGSGWIEDTVVFGEALLLAQAFTQLTKFAVREQSIGESECPRPTR